MEEPDGLLNRKSVFISVIGLLLACLHNWFFFGVSLGVSYPLFILLFYVYFFAQTKEKMNRLWDFSWFLFAVILALSMTFALYTNELFYVLNFLAIPVLIAVHTTVFASPRSLRWFDPRIVWNVLDHLFPQTFRHVPKPFKLLSGLIGNKLDSRVKGTLGKVLIGLAISFPLLFIVIRLLSSADQAFGQLLLVIPDWFDGVSIGEGFVRFVWILVVFLFLFGYVLGFVDTKIYDWEKAQSPEKTDRPRAVLDPVIVLTVLIAVNVVYLLFAAIQFSYLFGAWGGELPDGTTYAEHARSGFLELVTVAIINFGLLIGSLSFGKEDRSVLSRWNRIGLTCLVVCTSIMLVSAFVRLHLYEEVYGYTYIRFLVHAFMIYLGILLLVSGYRIWQVRVSMFKLFAVISISAYVILNYVGMDRMIADKNIERYLENGRLDVVYLSGLSWEAVPRLVDFSEKYEELTPYLLQKYELLAQNERDWRSFNWSRYQALKMLEKSFKGEPDVSNYSEEN